MNKTIQSLACLVFASSLFGAVDGVVTNGTTSQPAAGVALNLVQPGQKGMQTLGSTITDASGHFRFDVPPSQGGPQLLQAVYKGVTYTKFLPPGTPTESIGFPVYDTTKSPSEAHVSQHMIVVEPADRQVGVSESILVENKSNATYSNDELGAVRIYVPAAANGQIGVSVKGTGGMPLQRSAEKTRQPDVYKISFPIKPGETEFDITYVLPGNVAQKFPGRIVGVEGQPAGPLRMVAPAGVVIEGEAVRKLGTEPKTQATIYDVVANGAYSVVLKGFGSLHAASDAAGGDAAVDTSDSPQVESNPPPVYRRLPYLAALCLSILAVGFILLFRASPVRDL